MIAIVTAENAGKLEQGQASTPPTLLGGPEIQHYHQAIALVVAETFEQARAAAQLIRVDYAREPGRVRSCAAAQGRSASKPTAAKAAAPPTTAVGDFDGAFAAAPVKLDATYTTPDQSHAMMEPHATIAAWEGDKLTLWTSNQMIDWARATSPRRSASRRRTSGSISPYIGGGFGGKLFLRADAVLAALGARARRPAGQGGAAPAADAEQHDAPAGDDPAHPHRRDARRQDHRHRARELVGQLARRQARDGGRPDAAALRRREPPDRDAARRCSTCRKATPCARPARRRA